MKFRFKAQDANREQLLEQANNLQLSLSGFRVKDMQPFFSLLKQSSYPLQQVDIEDIEHKPRQLFIVGMPRSGSTLLEQMLLGHTAIDSIGESSIMVDELASQIFQKTGKTM